MPTVTNIADVFKDSKEDQEKKSTKLDRSLRPLTVKQIIHVTIEDEDCFFIDSKAIYNVCVVGTIRCISQFDAFTTLSVDDGTGCIELKMGHESTLESKEEIDQTLSVLKAGMYIKSIGRLKYTSSKLFVSAIHIRPIEDMNELTYHMLDAIYFHLTLVKKTSSIMNKSIEIGDDVLDRVKKAIQQCSGKEGTHIQVVCQHLCNEMSESKVTEAIEELMFEGQVYNVTNELIKLTD